MKLFTKSYSKDMEWLRLAIKSVCALCSEDIEWTIAVESCDVAQLESILADFHNSNIGKNKASFRIAKVEKEWPDSIEIQNGYMRQQWVKMNAHRAVPSGIFWHWDSDVIAVKSFDSSNLRSKNGKPIYWFSQFNSLFNGSSDDQVHRSRMNLMKEICGINEVSIEYMRCLPLCSFTEILNCGAGRSEWSKSFDLLKSGDRRFSEFNVIGLFSHLHFPDAFDWKNAESSGPTWSGGWDSSNNCFQTHAIACQSWSYGGIPDYVKKFVESL